MKAEDGLQQVELALAYVRYVHERLLKGPISVTLIHSSLLATETERLNAFISLNKSKQSSIMSSLPTEISDNPTEAGHIANEDYSLDIPPSQLQPTVADSTISELSAPSTLISGPTTTASPTIRQQPTTERERCEQLREEIATNRAIQETAPTPLPALLLQTMSESVRRSKDDDEARDMILDANTKLLLSADQNAVMMSEFIDGDGMVKLHHDSFRKDTAPIGAEPTIYTMTRSLVLGSKRVRSLLPEKKRLLLKTLNEKSSESEVLDFLMVCLPNELSLTTNEQQRICNDVLDNRFYRLVLPDGFDCLDQIDDRCSLCQGDLSTTWGTSELRCCSRQLCSVCMYQAKVHSKCPHCSSFLADRSELSHV